MCESFLEESIKLCILDLKNGNDHKFSNNHRFILGTVVINYSRQ